MMTVFTFPARKFDIASAAFICGANDAVSKTDKSWGVDFA